MKYVRPVVFTSLAVIAIMSLLQACATHPEMTRAKQVDLDRFMGAWFVVGYSPLFVDKEAHNAVEHYHLAENGDIETTYQFRKGSFDAPLKTLKPVGRVHDEADNAEWRMQFVWPIKAAYIILYVSDDYQHTIVAHPNRKYAWIMQREPEVDEKICQEMLGKLADAGFNTDEVIQRVPHDWSNESERLEIIRNVGKSRPLAER